MNAPVDIIDEFTTIGLPAGAEMKVGGSRFIAEAFPCADRAAAASLVEKAANTFFDATHHCYAWRFGAGCDQFRSHDDGEPSGSAGKPILAAIDGAGLTDILVVVTRYFGGKKLGVGGLVRAYGTAAASVLEKAEKKLCLIEEEFVLSYPHPLTSSVMRVLSTLRVRVIGTVYDDDAHCTVAVRLSQSERLVAGLIEQSSGGVKIERKSTKAN